LQDLPGYNPPKPNSHAGSPDIDPDNKPQLAVDRKSFGLRPPWDAPSPTSSKSPLLIRLRISWEAFAFDQPVILDTSVREILPCLRNARMISASAESTRIGAAFRGAFFALGEGWWA